MGEENKEEQKKEEAKKEKKEEEKKEEETPEIVLKVDMHCEACARKVARALKGFEGVDDITADSKASKVVVKGKTADPIKVCERLQKKSGRKVELISPLPKPPPPDADDQEKKEQQKVEKKEEPPAAITVVLNVRMHCEACAQGLRKRIRKIQGIYFHWHSHFPLILQIYYSLNLMCCYYCRCGVCGNQPSQWPGNCKRCS
ncbi:hypothetical protein CISIN_1g024847mg [Citrus sinensis]|uniref:HMA domain-containing protein n=1 Tax=Citrus sinensis TaxID=2711 RepID=A0A067GFP5_CITSI|nr:hypothetical protein CISIN_1g024847mg [Citrus sinensis]